MTQPHLRGRRLRSIPRHPAGQPIGFLLQRPNPAQSQPTFSPFGTPHMPPQGGGPFSPFSPPSPPAQSPGFSFPGNPSVPGSPPAPGGLQGLLQGLMGGGGSLDLPGLISNAQKWIGVFNQFGSILKQAGPLLQLVQGLSGSADSFSDDDTLTELTDEEETAVPKKTKSKRKLKKTKTKVKGKRKRRRRKKQKEKEESNTSFSLGIKKHYDMSYQQKNSLKRG
ncbi:hypothetical protein J2S00_003212 [Caldalkalibacillus uzonensis]|uniref:Uncharacterized protein n=1 Tax=Caldalkalibacillus uzonensis TaxID=353224 RepID=A0ABU0CVG6_9BACI|nr:VrrA/YqfQ family protein [Caldalkalibacillus uzonensis]MDQ0340403.1 hypothetical protein [Caldalkalibacillus uzonensis]